MAQPDAAELKQIRSTKFPEAFKQKVDIRKVNMEVVKKWMAQRITELLGMEDDVTVDFAYELMTDKNNFFPNIKLLQIKMAGFLGEKDSAKFSNELWGLMLSAQESALGVPAQLLEAKKAELLQEREAAERRAQEDRRRKELESARDREIDERRRRDRDSRGDRRDRDTRGRGGGGRGDRGDRGDRRRPRSRSPPRHRGSDTYEPSSDRRRYRSRTPPRRRSPPPRRRDDSPPARRRDSTPPPRRRRGSSVSSKRTSSPPSRRISPLPRRRRNTSSAESDRGD